MEWSQDEIHKSVEVLKIPKEEISAYFFDSVVQEIEPEIQEGDKTSTNGISGKSMKGKTLIDPERVVRIETV